MPTRGIQPSFAAGVIGPGLWGRVDLAKYDVALRLGVNVFIHPYGGVSNRPGFEFVGEVSDSDVEHRLIPFERDDEANYILEFGPSTMRVIRDGVVLKNATTATVTAITQGATTFISAVNSFSNGDQVELSGVVGMTEINDRTFFVANVTGANFEIVDLWGNSVNSTSWGAYVSGGTASVAYRIASPYPAANIADLDYAQSADVMFFADRSVSPRKVSRVGDVNWVFDTVDVDPTNAAPTGLTVTYSGSGSGETYTYVVTSVDENGVESFQSSQASDTGGDIAIAGNKVDLSWTAATGAVEYNIYKERNGVFGFIGFTEGVAFTDDNIEATLESTPPEASGLFGSADNYPGAVTLVQQRLIFGGSNNEPETIWMSRTADFENFTKSRILAPADRIEVGLAGRSVNSVRQLLGLRELLVFAARGEFSVTGAQGFLSAVEPVVTQYGYTGAKNVKPLVVNETALFVEPSGRVVRDLRYAFEQDGYTGNELSILAYHYFLNRTVKQWAFAQSPDSLVWVVMDDGTLLSMTYKREHQVWAWCEHSLGEGVTVESIASVLEGDRDAIYIIAKKTINGVSKRYILRQRTRSMTGVEDAFFVDFGLSYDGSPATVFGGLRHMEGETLTALADGNVFPGLVVSDGQITLPRAASKVAVGTYTVAEFETLPPALDLRDAGSSRGRPQKNNRVFLQVEDSRGIEVGPSRDVADLTKWIQTGGPDLSAAIPYETGFIEFTLNPKWDSEGVVYVRQPDPLPMTVLAIAPDRNIGR